MKFSYHCLELFYDLNSCSYLSLLFWEWSSFSSIKTTNHCFTWKVSIHYKCLSKCIKMIPASCCLHSQSTFSAFLVTACPYFSTDNMTFRPNLAHKFCFTKLLWMKRWQLWQVIVHRWKLFKFAIWKYARFSAKIWRSANASECHEHGIN